METKIIIGFFVGVLCGIVPLIFGFLKEHKILGIVGIIASAAAGALFNALDKSPFSAFVVAVLFLFIIIASNKSRNKKNDDSEDSFYDN
jgi:uncharacterized membrane protein YfcA